MQMVAHNPAAAKRAGVPQSVGREYASADKRKAALVRALRRRG